MTAEAGATSRRSAGDDAGRTAEAFGTRIAVHGVTHRVVFVSYRGGHGGYNKGKHCVQQVNSRSLRDLGMGWGCVWYPLPVMSAEDLPKLNVSHFGDI